MPITPLSPNSRSSVKQYGPFAHKLRKLYPHPAPSLTPQIRVLQQDCHPNVTCPPLSTRILIGLSLVEMRTPIAHPNPVCLRLGDKTSFTYFGITPQPKSDASHPKPQAPRRGSVPLPLPRTQIVGMKQMESQVEPEVCVVQNMS